MIAQELGDVWLNTDPAFKVAAMVHTVIPKE